MCLPTQGDWAAGQHQVLHVAYRHRGGGQEGQREELVPFSGVEGKLQGFTGWKGLLGCYVF